VFEAFRAISAAEGGIGIRYMRLLRAFVPSCPSW
jgi:hypothetical protein